VSDRREALSRPGALAVVERRLAPNAGRARKPQDLRSTPKPETEAGKTCVETLLVVARARIRIGPELGPVRSWQDAENSLRKIKESENLTKKYSRFKRGNLGVFLGISDVCGINFKYGFPVEIT
jgi:hypothetical protein